MNSFSLPPSIFFVTGSTDAARAAADIVLTQPGLNTIILGITLAREIFQRMVNFITYRIAASLQLLFFFFFAVVFLHPSNYVPVPLPPDWKDDMTNEHAWPYFYRMPVLMLMLITLLNDGALLSIGYDRVTASPRPCVWNLRLLFVVSGVMAAIACVSSLLLLHACLDSWSRNSIFSYLGLKPLSYGEITTALYLKVSVSDFLTLFSARAGSKWFGATRPAGVVIVAALIALTLSTIIAAEWPKGDLDEIPVIGLAVGDNAINVLYVWIYCFIVWIIQDLAKVLTFYICFKYNVFGCVDDHHAGFKNYEEHHPDHQFKHIDQLEPIHEEVEVINSAEREVDGHEESDTEEKAEAKPVISLESAVKEVELAKKVEKLKAAAALEDRGDIPDEEVPLFKVVTDAAV